MGQSADCNQQEPLCLYDFTTNHTITDFLVFSLPNTFDSINENYFYVEDYRMESNWFKIDEEVKG